MYWGKGTDEMGHSCDIVSDPFVNCWMNLG